MTEWLRIATSVEVVRLLPKEIVYVEADGNYCDIHLFNGSTYTLTQQMHVFEKIFETLKNNPFVRVGKSLIVNRNYISRVSKSDNTIAMMGMGLKGEFRAKASRDAIKFLKEDIEKGGKYDER